MTKLKESVIAVNDIKKTKPSIWRNRH